MSEDYTIQCDNCGAVYDDVEEVCPYCGQPNPLFAGEETDLPEAYDDRPEYDERYYARPDSDLLYDEELAGEDEFYQAAGPVGSYADEIEELAPDREVREYDWLPGPVRYEGEHELYGGYEEDEEPTGEEAGLKRRSTLGRMMAGCLGLFVCIGLLYGAVALVAAYNGLRERALNTQTEAEEHYRRGQEHLKTNELDLAIAEFEMALSLNPNYLEARQALRDVQGVARSQPTSTSETRSAAAAAILKTAEAHLEEQNWFEAVQTLAQVRDLDPDYRADEVSKLLYTANYQLGLGLLDSGRIEEAMTAFEHALTERPGDSTVSDELDKASLYLEGETAEQTDRQKAVDTFSLLYRKDPDYLDVKDRLVAAHTFLGDELAADGDWCLAEAQYLEALDIQPSNALEEKADTGDERCQEETLAQPVTPTPRRATPTTVATRTASGGSQETAAASGPGTAPTAEDTREPEQSPAPSGGSSGSIVYSGYNPSEKQWEILSVPASGGTPRVLVVDGTMPAVSPDGRSIVYHSERIEAEGFHRYDFATGEDVRITIRPHHILPRWAGDSSEFLFVAQEPGTGRWQVYLGFADGKSDPLILRDGRTADWSPDKSLIAYQGTDPAGNQPGIYLVPYGGGEAERLTTHESDRSPDFSPNGSRLAYMSAANGSWNIYTVGVNGGAPQQVTTTSGNHGLPRWSPDGSQIAYVSDSGGSWAIYVINAGGGTPTRVTAWDGLNHPDWLLAQIDWTR